MPSSSPIHLPIETDPAKCATLLRAGAILVYPTETYYAIGCMANASEAVKNIFQLKRRPEDKPLPLLASSLAQATLIADLSILPSDFLRHFWPGPLTVIAQGENVPAKLLNRQRKLAIRVSSLPLARKLASAVGFPLVCTSANFTGQAAVPRYEELDRKLLEQSASFSATILPWHGTGAGQPSTIVEPLRTASGLVLKMHRQGAIATAELQKWMPVVVSA